MKKLYIFSAVLMVLSLGLFGQGKNISLSKKSRDPYITLSNDTINVGDEIRLQEGASPNGSFFYVQLLNKFNEPIRVAESRFAFKRQKVSFFKEQDGTTYLFTEYFLINIEAALHRNEIKLVKKK